MVKLIVNLEGVFLHLHILILEVVLSIIVVGLILELFGTSCREISVAVYELCIHIMFLLLSIEVYAFKIELSHLILFSLFGASLFSIWTKIIHR